jgi:hypothetical protein
MDWFLSVIFSRHMASRLLMIELLLFPQSRCWMPLTVPYVGFWQYVLDRNVGGCAQGNVPVRPTRYVPGNYPYDIIHQP